MPSLHLIKSTTRSVLLLTGSSICWPPRRSISKMFLFKSVKVVWIWLLPSKIMFQKYQETSRISRRDWMYKESEHDEFLARKNDTQNLPKWWENSLPIQAHCHCCQVRKLEVPRMNTPATESTIIYIKGFICINVFGWSSSEVVMENVA